MVILFSLASYDGNPGLHKGTKKNFKLILGISIGVLVILAILFLASLMLMHKLRKASQRKCDENGQSVKSYLVSLTR